MWTRMMVWNEQTPLPELGLEHAGAITRHAWTLLDVSQVYLHTCV